MAMNKFGVSVVVLGSLLLSNSLLAQPQSCQVNSGEFVTPVVELYTSEGCSSCPPADRWFSSQIKRNDIDANYLSFHVDYWDDIGWPDKFANAEYSQRQRARVRQKGSSTVYTPQVMIGEQTAVTWYRPEQFENPIKKISKQFAAATIGLQSQGSGAKWQTKVQISSPNGLSNAQWYLATYEDGLSSQVRAGENRGILLKHDRVVRQWLGPYRLSTLTANKDFAITLPKAASVGQVGFLVVLENAQNGQVIQSLRLPLSQCKATRPETN
jgi:hypothetical protein